jgi:hypothetical protein
MTSGQILEKAKQTQVETETSLNRTIHLVEQTKNLHILNFQIIFKDWNHNSNEFVSTNCKSQKIEEGVDEVRVTLQLANKQVRSYARQIATDKIFILLIVLISVCIIFIAIWYIVNGVNPADPPPNIFT